MSERDYVLGTSDDEIRRLGLQHRVWRPWMLAGWRDAGVTTGSRVIDVGAGPGFATVDLAEIVGPTGQVVAVERSQRFAAAARQRCAARGAENVRVFDADLMNDAIAAADADVAWCRWVASFVSSPKRLVEAVADALRPGGTAIFHEYADYAAWRLLPPRPAFESFVAAVMASWRATGGEPDVALALPQLLCDAGFDVRAVRPLVFTVDPGDFVWQWPSAFLHAGVVRLQQLGMLGHSDAEKIRGEFVAAERDPVTRMMTPLVMEIIAVRRS